MTLVSCRAPDFIAPAVMNKGKIISDFHFNKYTLNKYSVIFFWPMDFTFVCPSEIISFNNHFQEFENRNVKIIGISCDSQFVHKAWCETPIEKGGIGHIQYPIVSDIKKEIQKAYDVEHPDLSIALRASFLIDKQKIIRHQVINDLPLGRNIDEMIRMIDALQFHEKNGEVCPAKWNLGKPGIKTTTEGISKFLSKYSKEL